MIELKNISVNFGKLQVLDDISFLFKAGEVVGLVAPNGTGKSTMLNVMMNYLKPQTGEVIVNGSKTYKKDSKKNELYQVISMMPDQNDLYGHLSGYDHLKLYQELWQTTRLSVEDIVSELEMSHYVKKKVSSYSLGMKQRLCFALQIMSDTSIMLMDEVMNGLDPKNVELISQVIVRKKNEGKTIIIASHLLENLEKYSDRIYFLENGKMNLYLDKEIGYGDKSIYIKIPYLEENVMNKLSETYPIIHLSTNDSLLRLEDKTLLEQATNELIANGIIQFSVGNLSLADAYKLKF